ncbi:MAG: ABC transporter ATP-binding protein [Lachnospiraceae bacterium]|jgi:ATP-binding cassette subfamily B multidrug efflux pump|nr:ABC transporter ATP-binding protein [Lachnospiraceae bacterium]
MKKVLSFIRPHSALVLLSLLMAVVSVVLTLYVPVLTGRVIDEIVGPGAVQFERIARIMKVMVFIVLITAAAQWVMNVANNRIVCLVSSEVREQAFEKIEILPVSYLDAHSSGDLVSRVIADVDQFADGLLLGFTQFFTGVATILGTLVFMLVTNAGITLVVVLLTPVSLLAARFIAQKTYAMFRMQSEARGEQTALVDEMVANQKVVQAYGQEKNIQGRFDKMNERLRSYSLRAVFFSSITNPVTRFVNSLVYTGVGLTGALCVVRGVMSVGQLSAFLSYANQYTKPFNEISGVVTELQNALACAGRVFELLEAPAQTPDAEAAKELPDNPGSMSLEHVNFSYVPEKKLIQDFNLKVKAGQRVAIVGPTGCGKTTLINLLMRFYDVNSGAIKIEGTDIREVKRHDLRSTFGMVLQDTWLSGGTIRDNIAMGRPEAEEKEIIEAAKRAHAHSFIRRLPRGYDTVIGENGGSLSQGQKQLLCIARVMLCLPPMLILDEATSSIDIRTEARIQEAFHSMMQGRTSFIVAHRLSTIQNADVILVMQDGNVIEQGNHESLLKKGGAYARLYNSQFVLSQADNRADVFVRGKQD